MPAPTTSPTRGGAPLVLVSGSPRRRALIERLGVPVIVAEVSVDETPVDGLCPVEQSVRIARAKLDAFLRTERGPARWALAADTLVYLDDRPLGKALSAGDARAMLSSLSGRTHQVVTGLALANPLTRAIADIAVTTEVQFSRLSEAEIDRYLSSGEWRDAAGAYRIQERGELFVDEIRGSYSNVVGLPLGPLYRFLLLEGYPFA